ncbi:MAG: undecaprenyl/decaprenyl-phosphate alpha-N-acetylglucosaminyl 1-phosphate transferase [Chloroflexi bacterium]|nr:undecaprenyl/decaprenyl-phosphate alpha-N-acetylglucosaminyl 1-phosphate transferase [Chloroflexota bacterium]
MLLNFFVTIFMGAIFTLLLVSPGIRIAVRYRLLDHPFSAPHKTHQNTVPKAGGLAIFFAVFLVTVIGGKFAAPEVLSILLASAVIFIFGLWDDAKGLSAGWKLTGQMLAASVLLWQGIQIRMFVSAPLLNLTVTCFWIVGITNAFNLVDSMDSLAVGLAAIASVFFLFVTVDSNEMNLAFLSAVLLGSCIGMFFFNAPPARTFLGDSGAQFLGFMLATIAMAYTPQGFVQTSSWFVPILLLSVPILDTALVIISRTRQGLPFYKAGQDHLYHRLTQLGLSPVQSVTLMHVAALLTGCLAFITLPLPPLWANMIFGLTALGGLFFIFWLEKNRKPNETG